jgi:hypothetical protein
MNTEKFRAYFLVASFAVSVSLIIALLAATHSGDVLAWTEFWTKRGEGVMTYSLGYRVITECWIMDNQPEANQCVTQSIQDYDRALNGVCHKGGTGVIVSYTFTMLLSFIATAVLLSGKGYTKKLINNANIVTLLTLTSLALAIVPIGVWYADCQSTLSGATVSYGKNGNKYPINDLHAGGGIGLSATIIAAYAIAAIVSIWRSVMGCVDSTASIYNDEALIVNNVFSSTKYSTSKMPWNHKHTSETSATNNFSISVHADL